MATDSTELTFVRCPSCRSLVPAVSTRCRMCGAGLDSLDKLEKEENTASDLQKSGRVRQRTMSAPSDPLNRAAADLRRDLEESAIPKVANPAPSEEYSNGESHSENESFDDDPLGAYVEEIAESPAKVADPLSMASAEPLQAEEPTWPPPTPASFNVPPVQQEAVAETDDSWLSEEEEMDFGEDTAASPVSRFRKRRRKFKKVATAAPVEKIAVPSTPVATVPKPPPVAKPIEPVESAGQGVLVGWLISYRDPRGVAIELREGKFFVTRNSFKDADMVIDDESISTPHCLVRIQSPGRVELQDMMSDTGLAVKRPGAKDFSIEERAKLSHGDWIRIGALEYLVSLVPTEGGV